MKTKTILLSLIAFSISVHFEAQNNASYKLNTAPIGGTYNTGMGWNALRLVAAGRYNSALGYEALFNNTSGEVNVASGYQALYNNTVGHSNTANGSQSLFNNSVGYGNVAIGLSSLFNNVDGHDNVANGIYSLWSNVGGNYNVANGARALYSNIANYNVATGASALENNTTGTENTADGYNSLSSNTTGAYNTANGSQSLLNNTTGYYNVATGYWSLFSNTTGDINTAVGVSALYFNTTGYHNTGIGAAALTNNTSGYENTASGRDAMLGNTTGYGNTANGHSSMQNNSIGKENTSVGYLSFLLNTTGNNNTTLGSYSDVFVNNLNNSTAIGAYAVVNTSNKIRLGSPAVTICEIAATAVYTGSDGRFKTNVKEDDVKGLDFITKLRPVVYNFETKKFEEFMTSNMPDSIRKAHLSVDFEPSRKIRHSGFIAQEVEKAAEETGYNFDGIHKPISENDNYSLAYSQFVVPLVKAVQEQQLMIEGQKRSNDQLKEQLEDQKQLISELQAKNVTTNGTNQNIGLSGFSMDQNEPNPFNNETVIKYTLPQNTVNAYLAIYDLSGKQIKTIELVQKSATSLTITSDQLAAGIYIYSILADGKVIGTKRMVVSDK
jgi:hypothetical protein